MSDHADFARLYLELGVEPGCSVGALRLAYRRRVAWLHPDRAGASGEDELKGLNLRYAAALAFHSRYGRLPGQAPVAVPPTGSGRMGAGARVAQEEAEPSRRGTGKWLVYCMMLLAVSLIWWLSHAGEEQSGVAAVEFMDFMEREREVGSPEASSLRIGMSQAEVVALLKEPTSREHDDRKWGFGPSWIRFHCGSVVDWYSSPLRPLKTAEARPGSSARGAIESVSQRRCPNLSAREARLLQGNP